MGFGESYGYDSDRNVIALTDRNGHQWSATFDERGNRLTDSSPLDGCTWRTTYDDDLPTEYEDGFPPAADEASIPS